MAEDIRIDDRRREPLGINNNLFSFGIQQCDRRIIKVEHWCHWLCAATPELFHVGSKCRYFSLFISLNFCFPFFPLFRFYLDASCVLFSLSLSLPVLLPLVLMGIVWPHFVRTHFEKCSLEVFSSHPRIFYVRINYETSFQRCPPALTTSCLGFFFVLVRSVDDGHSAKRSCGFSFLIKKLIV